MRKIATLLVWIAIAPVLYGCGEQSNQQVQPVQQVAVPVEKPRPDVSGILAGATELREEKLFLVTLEFKKQQLTIDLWEHVKNAIATERRTLIVGERTFNEYQIGQKVSSVGDGWGFVFNGEIAEYVVSPVEKKVESQYFWADGKGAQAEIIKEQYDEAIQQLQSSGRQVVSVPFAGAVRTYILERPLAEYQFTDRQPLNRYFVTIRVENSTFTLDLTKHIRNAANTHDITLEVPREVYEKTGEAWDAQLSTGSLIMKGRLSELHGKVIRKWSEVDDGYQLVRTADGHQFIIPR